MSLPDTSRQSFDQSFMLSVARARSLSDPIIASTAWDAHSSPDQINTPNGSTSQPASEQMMLDTIADEYVSDQSSDTSIPDTRPSSIQRIVPFITRSTRPNSSDSMPANPPGIIPFPNFDPFMEGSPRSGSFPATESSSSASSSRGRDWAKKRRSTWSALRRSLSRDFKPFLSSSSRWNRERRLARRGNSSSLDLLVPRDGTSNSGFSDEEERESSTESDEDDESSIEGDVEPKQYKKKSMQMPLPYPDLDEETGAKVAAFLTTIGADTNVLNCRIRDVLGEQKDVNMALLRATLSLKKKSDAASRKPNPFFNKGPGAGSKDSATDKDPAADCETLSIKFTELCDLVKMLREQMTAIKGIDVGFENTLGNWREDKRELKEVEAVVDKYVEMYKGMMEKFATRQGMLHGETGEELKTDEEDKEDEEKVESESSDDDESCSDEDSDEDNSEDSNEDSDENNNSYGGENSNEGSGWYGDDNSDEGSDWHGNQGRPQSDEPEFSDSEGVIESIEADHRASVEAEDGEIGELGHWKCTKTDHQELIESGQQDDVEQGAEDDENDD